MANVPNVGPLGELLEQSYGSVELSVLSSDILEHAIFCLLFVLCLQQNCHQHETVVFNKSMISKIEFIILFLLPSL